MAYVLLVCSIVVTHGVCVPMSVVYVLLVCSIVVMWGVFCGVTDNIDSKCGENNLYHVCSIVCMVNVPVHAVPHYCWHCTLVWCVCC